MAPREKLPPIHPGELLRDELNGRKGVGVKGSDGFCPPSAPFTDSPNNPNPPSHKGLQPFSTLRAPLSPALYVKVSIGSGAGPDLRMPRLGPAKCRPVTLSMKQPVKTGQIAPRTANGFSCFQ